MITIEQYRDRSDRLYKSHRERWLTQLQKSMPRGVKLQMERTEILPFTKNQFGAWLWKQIQLQVILCPYCRAPIDVLSMEMDHSTPFSRGGGPGFDNLRCICARCNRVKADLTSDEYILLIAFLEGPGAPLRKKIEGALINGSIGKMSRFFPRDKAKRPAKVPQQRLDLEIGEF